MKTFSLILSVLLSLSSNVFAEGDDITWNSTLKTQFFNGKSIEESNDTIDLEVPYRAEDPAIRAEVDRQHPRWRCCRPRRCRPSRHRCCGHERNAHNKANVEEGGPPHACNDCMRARASALEGEANRRHRACGANSP